jgi:hypothetical protein
MQRKKWAKKEERRGKEGSKFPQVTIIFISYKTFLWEFSSLWIPLCGKGKTLFECLRLCEFRLCKV